MCLLARALCLVGSVHPVGSVPAKLCVSGRLCAPGGPCVLLLLASCLPPWFVADAVSGIAGVQFLWIDFDQDRW